MTVASHIAKLMAMDQDKELVAELDGVTYESVDVEETNDKVVISVAP